ncbi:putative colanic acid biosynthesis acetyltransferase WcaF [Agreia bicolorata]|uniref:Putative colanic acid biosynthesis acetyltransferase WcaF n=1 Tax=Agreia bicolorata TaxID=110935 RepID=A0A1T4WY06_9MICO|nr:putative colanic acid biosynthesis acetyltransferase WcaF [Agreia bicolorata]
MGTDDNGLGAEQKVPIIDLSKAPGERSAWDRPKAVVYCWSIAELLLVTNPWQISSALRSRVLRLFGAEIGQGVIFRPRTRVKFPWKLHIGDRSWIGEGVWFHNQDHVYVGHDVTISQETFITTGSHAHRRDMALVTRPVHIKSGAWIAARCVLLGGSSVGISALVAPGTVVNGIVPANVIWGTPPSGVIGERFTRQPGEASL